jgi:hypothetical protein
MVGKLQFTPPHVANSIMKVSLWCSTSFRGREFGISIFRAQEVHRVGLRNIGDLWSLEGNCLRPWEDVRDNIFQLEDGEQYCIRQKIVDSLPAVGCRS